MSQTLVPSETYWSRRTIVVACVLFLLVLDPVGSQIPSQTPARHLRPEMLDQRLVPPRRIQNAAPATPTRPPNETSANPEVSLSPDKHTVPIGEAVKFTATLRPARPEMIYVFDSDGEGIGGGRDQSTITRQFWTPGPHVVRVTVFGRGTKLSVSTTIQVIQPVTTATPSTAASPSVTPDLAPAATVTPPLKINLTVDKNPTSVGKSVTFLVKTNRRKEEHEYALNFGHASQPFRTKRNRVTHVFMNPGKYHVSVTVLDDPSKAGDSVDVTVTGSDITVTDSTSLYYVVVAALGLAAVGYLIHSRSKPRTLIAAQPTFHPHPDWDAPRKTRENLSINYELHFYSNLSTGQDHLDTGGASLISRKTYQ